jgi:hypothetical protein
MTESKHTPGPWDFDGPEHSIIVWAGPDLRVCFMTSNGPAEANARLITAAPDLLAALREMIEEHGQRDFEDALLPKKMQPREIWKAFDAIAKAEGPTEGLTNEAHG